ncbi:MAG: tetratricopeptide repeat protein [Rhodospirillaceae bacterium]|nr:tetratricopeptide repeat protein [Rhodospirillaceae bacterium]
MLQRAVDHHQAGRLDDAAALYEQVIAEDPRNADALNLLGAIAHARGQYLHAKTLYERALAAAPDIPDIHFNFGNLLAATGESDAAVAAYKRALALRPAFVDAHLGLGVEFHTRHRFEDAAKCFHTVVGLAPQDARGHFNLGRCLMSLRRNDEAATYFMKTAELQPENAEVPMLLADLHASAGRLMDALSHVRRAVALQPHPEYYSTLGELLRRVNHIDAALSAHETAVAMRPDDPAILHNYGASLHAAKQLRKAEDIFRRALARNAGFIKAYIGLAKVYEHLGFFDRAIATLEEALKHEPESADVRFKLSMLQLTAGKFEDGWRNYAYRMEDANAQHARRPPFPPYWKGEDLSGKTILIWTEQGIGDEILHAGMIPDIIARAGRCIVECSARMAPVLARSFPTAAVVAFQRPDMAVTPAESADYQLAAGDLGQFFRPDFDAFPRHAGYLKAERSRAAALRERYQSRARGNLVVGLAWRSGNKDIGLLKSADLANWGALLDLPGITFVNLQYGDCAAELAAVRSNVGVEIFQDSEIDSLKNMDDFFAQVAAMDLVISTSNTTVHVAGSLNVPVWLIDPARPGRLWYWFRNRAHSPWYPAMHIFPTLNQQVRDGVSWWADGVDEAARRLRERRTERGT